VYEWTGTEWRLLETCGDGSCEAPDQFNSMPPSDGKTIIAVPCNMRPPTVMVGGVEKLNFSDPRVVNLTNKPRRPGWPAAIPRDGGS
jgi:hypothetical protein